MNRLIYTKYSNERARQFAIRTDIMCGDNGRFVKKKAMYDLGTEHIQNIYRWYKELSARYANTSIHMNTCEQDESNIVLEYLEGNTLEHVLDSYLLKGQFSQLEEELFAYLEEVKKGFNLECFVPSEEFYRVFGKTKLPQDLLCGDVVNVDMVLNNVLLNQGWTLIDYEWTFDFAIPYNFVAFRILHYYLHGSSTRNVLLEHHLMEKAGISQEEVAAYEEMERHFQEVYLLTNQDGKMSVPVRFLYDAISPGCVEINVQDFSKGSDRFRRMIQLYWGTKREFSEKNSEKRECLDSGHFCGGFQVASECQYIRLDPASQYCRVTDLQIQWGNKIETYESNGVRMPDGSLLFTNDDPQIVFHRPEGENGSFQVEFTITYLSQAEALECANHALDYIHEQYRYKEQMLQQKEQLIQNMENTKAWKVYRKIKGK